jgi:hypothetical protein
MNSRSFLPPHMFSYFFPRNILPLIIVILAACMLPFMGCSGDRREIDTDAMSDLVKREFLHAWNGYKTYAWGYDALRPVSMTGRNWYDESLLMTPLDAFDTMMLMGLHEEAASAKQLVFERLSFDKDINVQVFEIVIRLLGGLISSYQIDGDPQWLELAVDLADRLLSVYDSPTGMPYVHVNLLSGESSSPVNNPAEIGTQILEFGMLSKLTGNPVYYETIKRAMITLFDRRSDIDLVGTTINVETGEWQDTQSHISGRIDSYYEYLLKAWLLFDDEDFKNMWDTHIAAINTYLADETESGLWYGWADMHTGERTHTWYGALDAFWPGVLALSGDLGRASALQESSFKIWNLHGIEAERIDYSTMEVISPGYPLRPEILESAYILYHYTQDPRYLEMGAVIVNDLIEHCRVEAGYTALQDVRTKKQADDMESFFLAETLKYAYLLFTPDALDFENIVFNTEAHPFRKTWD